MTIAEAKARCNELSKKINIIRKESCFDGWTKYVGWKEIKPLQDELNKLVKAIIRAENETEIKI